MLLDKTLDSHSASLHAGVKMGIGEFNAGVPCGGTASRPGGVEMLLVASC